jgi:hypothetical protein
MREVPAVALVVVRGGVAEVHEGRHAYVRIVDLDNIAADDPPVELPAGIGFENLCRQAGLDNKAVRLGSPDNPDDPCRPQG